MRNRVAPGDQPPPGLLYHAGGPSEGGLCVIEVWESQEALNRFFEDQVAQALQDANIATQPKIFRVTTIMQS